MGLFYFTVASLLLPAFIMAWSMFAISPHKTWVYSAIALLVTSGVVSSGWFLHDIFRDPSLSFPFLTFSWTGIFLGAILGWFVAILKVGKVRVRVEQDKVLLESKIREYESALKDLEGKFL